MFHPPPPTPHSPLHQVNSNSSSKTGSKLHVFWFSPSGVLQYSGFCFFFKIYLFLERGEGREKERERNINVCLPVTCPLLGIWPATQACALTGN